VDYRMLALGAYWTAAPPPLSRTHGIRPTRFRSRSAAGAPSTAMCHRRC